MNETTATTSSPVPGETVRIPADDTPWPSPVAAWSALTVLVLATMMNFLDRGVFMLMVESIKHDFELTDVQLGLLLGPAGIIFYVVVGIPLARLVDIYPRKYVLAGGVAITSGLTAVGGLVQNYGQMFASRMFVGVGGSAHAPGTYSMIADYFPPRASDARARGAAVWVYFRHRPGVDCRRCPVGPCGYLGALSRRADFDS